MPSAETISINLQTGKESSPSSMQNIDGVDASTSLSGEKTAKVSGVDAGGAITGNNNNNNEGSSVNAKDKNSGPNQPAAASNEAFNPLKQVIVTIEHKIRNLEKRKTKLESYRAIQSTGKELSTDQKAAVAKYDSVMATLDFAREFSKQMQQMSKDAEKEQKKQARKDVVVRAQAETAKIREVLIIQNILTSFGDEHVRNDFLNGSNGAVQLEADELNVLEKFYIDSQPSRPESVDKVDFSAIAQKAAEHFSMTIDGRPKQYGETTYENLRKVFNRINECGYLDKYYSASTGEEVEHEEEYSTTFGEGEETVTAEENSLEEGMEKLNVNETEGAPGADTAAHPSVESDVFMMHSQPQELQAKDEQLSLSAAQPPHSGRLQSNAAVSVPQSYPQTAAAAERNTPVHMAMYPTQVAPLQQVPPGGIINVAQQQQGPPPPQLVNCPPQQQQRTLVASPGAGQLPPTAAPMPIHNAPPGHYQPTTVHAVEQGFFKQQQQQFIQQIRPIAEVIGDGGFYFLQDSELDSPEIGNVTAGAPPIGGMVFEQQPTQQQQQQELHKQQQPPASLISHADISNPVDLLKSQEAQQLMQHTLQQQQQSQGQQQPIPSQTFTNQSFPPMPQASPSPVTGGVNIGGNSALTSNTPSPMFQQKHQQLFSPVAGLQQQQQQQLLAQQQHAQDSVLKANNASAQQQLLLNEQQQPMTLMARLVAPQVLLQQQHQQPNQQQAMLGLQQSDVSSGNSGFPFDNPVMTAVTYDQHMQQQLVNLQSSMADVEQKATEDVHKFSADSVSDWDTNLQSASNAVSIGQTNVAATAALTNVLKPSVMETNNWSTEMNSVGTPAASSGSNSQMRKNDWTSPGSSFGETSNQTSTAQESNHWNSNQTPTSDLGGYGRSGVNRGPSGYHQRRGDERRDNRDDRRRDDRSGGGGSSGGGYRPPHARGSASQQNGGRGGNGGGGGGSGLYFRNNDASGTGSSYYQNGGGNNVYGKDTGSRYDSGGGGGSNYRGPRGAGGNGGGNASNPRGNPLPPPPRNIPRNSGGGGNGGGGNSSSYINRQSNRIPMGIENKN